MIQQLPPGKVRGGMDGGTTYLLEGPVDEVPSSRVCAEYDELG
jgi:hypothetical protein